MLIIYFCRSSRQEVYCKKDVLGNFAKFKGKQHLCQCSFFNKVTGLWSATLLKKRLWHSCFPVNLKFVRTSFIIGHLWWLILFLIFTAIAFKRPLSNLIKASLLIKIGCKNTGSHKIHRNVVLETKFGNEEYIGHWAKIAVLWKKHMFLKSVFYVKFLRNTTIKIYNQNPCWIRPVKGNGTFSNGNNNKKHNKKNLTVPVYFLSRFCSNLLHALVRSSHQKCSLKKLLFKISQISQKKTCVGISFW